MDRAITYVGEQLKALDVARTNTFSMVGIGKLAKAILGAGISLNDLTCVPTGPASLSVLLNPGEIYNIENVDNSAFGPLPANTSQQIVKCGQLLAQQTFTFTPPITAGQSIDYLIQASYQDVDAFPESRPFYLAAPQTVDTVRQGILEANVKAGLPATTGTQTPPAPDSGYAGAWVVTVANGQTQIIAGDISAYPGAPFIIDKLKDKISEAQADIRYPLAASFDNSVTANGYQKFPGGLIMQWGTISIPFTSGQQTVSQSVTFPIPFSVPAYSCIPNVRTSSSVTIITANNDLITATNFLANVSTTGTFGVSGNFDYGWIAIGN